MADLLDEYLASKGQSTRPQPRQESTRSQPTAPQSEDLLDMYLGSKREGAAPPPVPEVKQEAYRPTPSPAPVAEEEPKDTSWLHKVGKGLEGALWKGIGGIDRAGTSLANALFGKDSIAAGMGQEIATMFGVTAQDMALTDRDKAVLGSLLAPGGIGVNTGIAAKDKFSEKKDPAMDKAGRAIVEAGRKLTTDANPVSKIDKYYADQNENMAQYYAKETEGSKVAEAINEYGPMVVQAIPDAVIAIATGGGSQAQQLTTEGLKLMSSVANAPKLQQIAAMAGQTVRSMAKNPSFVSSLAQGTGNSYAEAIDDGASPEEAFVYAMLNGTLAAAVEVGGGDDALGGIQSLPRHVQDALRTGNKEVLYEFAKSTVNEVGEEVIQGIIERGMKPVYGKETYLTPGEGRENVVFDPAAMAEEAKGAAIVSSILGGGQIAAQKAINSAADRRAGTGPVQVQENEKIPETPSEIKTKEEVKTEQPTDGFLKPTEERETAESVITTPESEKAQNGSESVAESGAVKEPTLDSDSSISAEDVLSLSDEGVRERGFSENIRTDENMEGTLRKGYEDDPLLYRQKSNQEVEAAAKDIFVKGTEEAKKSLSEMIGQAKGGAKLALEAVPLSKLVANELAMDAKALEMAGDVDGAAAKRAEARNYLTDIAVELTYAGQLGQAAKILRYTGPSGRVLAVIKTVDKLNNKLKKTKVKVPDNLLDALAAAETDEDIDAATDAIEQNIADQIPATFMEKLNALRYLNMLGNFKTQIRNVVGNATNIALRKASNAVAELGEIATGQERTKSLWAGAELLKEAKADYKNARDAILSGGKFSDGSRKLAQGIDEKRTIFKTKALEKYRTITDWAMDVGDSVFAAAAYADALGGWAKAHGFKSIADMDADTLSRARQYAIKEAQEATFRDNSTLAEAFNSMRYKGDNPIAKAISKGGEAIMPFRKTPANVLARALEYSPFGLLNTAFKGAQMKSGKMKMTGSELISLASKNLTGTGLYLLGTALAAAGRARGAEDDEKLSNFQKQQGLMDWSVDINGDGDWKTLDWASPAALPFFMGVQAQQLSEGEGFSLASIWHSLVGLSDVMLNMSMLQGVNDALENLSQFGDGPDALPQFVMNTAISLLNQTLSNSLLRQGEYASQENRMTSYTDPNGKLDRNLQYPLAKLTSGIPGIDYNQAEFLDAWGREQSNGSAGKRIASSFLSPWYESDDRSTEVDEELERIYKIGAETGDSALKGVLPQRPRRTDTVKINGENVVLTPEEYQRFAKTKGQQSLALVSDFMDSAQYKDLNDSERAAVISKLYTLAKEKAANELRRERGAAAVYSSQTYKNLGSDENIVEYVTAKESLDSRTEVGDYKAVDALVKNYGSLPKEVQDALASNTDADRLYALKDDVSAAEFYKAMEGQKKETAKNGTGGMVKVQGIINSGVSDAVVDALAADTLGSGQIKRYDAARDIMGLSPQESINFWLAADTNGNNDYSKGEITDALVSFYGSKRDSRVQAVLDALYKPSEKKEETQQESSEDILSRYLAGLG